MEGTKTYNGPLHVPDGSVFWCRLLPAWMCKVKNFVMSVMYGQKGDTAS